VIATEGATAIASRSFLPWRCPAVAARAGFDVEWHLIGALRNRPRPVTPHRTERAFALFYSGVLGSGAIAPILFGAMGDWVGVRDATIATALTALAVLPLAVALAPHLRTPR
jgi:MFS family permease